MKPSAQNHGRPQSRPDIEVWRDSVRVVIRFEPLFSSGRWYPSWIIEYYLRGLRKRKRINSEKKARARAERIATRLAAGDVHSLELRGDERRAYYAASERLKSLGLGLEVAVQEFAEAKKIVKNADLREIARFYVKYSRTELKPITVPELVSVYATSLEDDKRGAYHVRDMRARLGRFAQAFPGQLSEVTADQIEAWLRNLTSLAKGSRRGDAPKGRTRNNYRNSIVAMFNYARTHSYLPRDLSTEASTTNRVSEADKRDNEIFSTDQIQLVLNKAKPHLIPSVAIKAFSGVRTEEIFDMEWEHISFKRGHIILPKTITKKNRRRIIPILPNLAKWLAPFEGLSGRICYRWATPQTVFQAMERHASRCGIKAGGNRFRNSYISYRVAQTGDAQKVSLEAGNSPSVIMEDYLELTTPEEARKWFGIEPVDTQLDQIANYVTKLKRPIGDVIT